jgi:DinB superfamily
MAWDSTKSAVEDELDHELHEEQTMKSASAVIDALERAPEIVLPLVHEVPPAVLKPRPAPGKWSAHEHACHLAVVHGDRIEELLLKKEWAEQPQ